MNDRILFEDTYFDLNTKMRRMISDFRHVITSCTTTAAPSISSVEEINFAYSI